MKKRAVLVVLAVLSVAFNASANPVANVYIAGSAAGTASGADCANAYDVSWFNDSGNWGSGTSQIGPATTVHLCGTLTVGVGATLLTAQGDGAAGQPITIVFEPGASITSPGMGVGIQLLGHAHFIVDGGTPCGYVDGPGSTDTACNGSIQNTANGDGLAHQVSTSAIQETGGDVEVRNLLFSNLYVATKNLNKPGYQPYPVCVYFAGAAPGLNFHNNIAHDLDWCLNGDADGVVMANNDIYNMDHGIGMGAGATHTGLVIHDNHMHDTAVWDTPADTYHHDGIHTYWLSSAHVAFSGALIYNNFFDGDWGANNTGMAEIWDQESATLFNNVAIGVVHLSDGLIDFSSPTGGPNNVAYNNTLVGCGTTCQYETVFQWGGQSGGGVTFRNNVISTGATLMTTQAGIDPPFLFSNNVYANAGASEPFYNGDYHTFSQWQGVFGESGSSFGSDAELGATGIPETGSPAIGAGTNLSSLCAMNGGSLPNALCADVLNRPRPTSGAWDVGAYQHCPSSGCVQVDGGTRDSGDAQAKEPRDGAVVGPEAGLDSAPGGGVDAGTKPIPGDGVTPGADGGGCSCRVGRNSTDAFWALGLVAILAARRRR
jgi:MYXO-CTERM domain-containing protein